MVRAEDLDGDVAWIGPGEDLAAPERFGMRAAWLARAAALGLPVPPALSIAPGAMADPARARRVAELWAARMSGDPVAALRPGTSGLGAAAPAILGLGAAIAGDRLAERLGARGAGDLRRRAVTAYARHVLRLDADALEALMHDRLRSLGVETEDALPAEEHHALAEAVLERVAAAGHRIPDDPAEAIAAALSAQASALAAPRAEARLRLRGIGSDTPRGLILQAMAYGIGRGLSGSGIVQRRCEDTGRVVDRGRFLGRSFGEEALSGERAPQVMTAAERHARGLPEPALAETAPEVAAAITGMAERLEAAFGESFVLSVVVEDGEVHLLDLRPARHAPRAALALAVDLAEARATDRARALLRVDPASLTEHLHPTVAPDAPADVLATGLAASPGAASGPLVFSPDAAEASAAEGRPAILALIETGPEDIRGMHAAAGVLTVRGGMTSHAALVARGLGRPCVVGARALSLDRGATRLTAPDGRGFGDGEILTVDGTAGRVIAGPVETRPPEVSGHFARLMGWADDARRLGLRANADTAEDAAVAHRFGAGGIGLCRTEHMFFQRGRIAAMQEMILADSAEARRAALARLKPMQAGDFAALFAEMAGLPVVIRLLDPPLHEFLPHGAEEMAGVADLLGMPVERVIARARELAEFNPMLGRRGCRIGIAYPEIYEMQVEAIFEAAADAGTGGARVRPEIMIPLVSTLREFEVVRERIDAVAARHAVDYQVGVMIETPRACLRAGDIARRADFLSFGTNDLTQMLYGLSRDDAGRFIADYVAEGVFAHDPFHQIDEEGVGEIIRLAIARARAADPSVTIGLCGEHGGDPSSIDFCERAGFDYVSCSPYRVPVARLAAAQARLRAGE